MAHNPTQTPEKAKLRRWILTTTLLIFLFGSLHHIDHLVRGNHVGWPVNTDFNGFTYSLLAYPLFAIGLSALTRGRVWAGYWLAYGILSFLLVVTQHFIPPFMQEPPIDVYMPYFDPLATDRYIAAPPEHLEWFVSTIGPYTGPLLAVLAMTILISLVVSLTMLMIVSFRVRRLQGHW